VIDDEFVDGDYESGRERNFRHSVGMHNL